MINYKNYKIIKKNKLWYVVGFDSVVLNSLTAAKNFIDNLLS